MDEAEREKFIEQLTGATAESEAEAKRQLAEYMRRQAGEGG